MKRFTKVLSVVLAAMFVVACFAGCSAKNSNKDNSESTKKALKVGFDQDGFEPFGYTDKDGNWIGFDIDVAKECVKLMDDYDSVQLVPIAWDSKDVEMQSGNVDVIWNGFTIDGRENDYQWTKPYMTNSQVILVGEKSGINSKSDLKGKLVGVQKDSSGLAAINKDKELLSLIKNGAPMQFDGYETAIMELKQGTVDAIVIDEQVIKVKMAKGNVTGFKLLNDTLSSENYGVAAKKGNTALADELQKALDTLAKNGKIAEISNKYFGYDATVWAKKTASTSTSSANTEKQ